MNEQPPYRIGRPYIRKPDRRACNRPPWFPDTGLTLKEVGEHEALMLRNGKLAPYEVIRMRELAQRRVPA